MAHVSDPKKTDLSRYANRRKALMAAIQDAYGAQVESSLVLFLAGFEHERSSFRQESSFYYLTGLEEPGVALTLDFQNESTLWIPNCTPARSQWMAIPVAFEQKNAAHFHVNAITFLGSSCTGYQFHPFFPRVEYEHLLSKIKKVVEQGGMIFTLCPSDSSSYVEQRLVLERIKSFIPEFERSIKDISPLVHAMRRRKDTHEIEMLYKAIEITNNAQIAAAHAIAPDVSEAEVQATLEYMMLGAKARPSFPSIVASGKNATILHYANNDQELQEDELVVVDVGAEFGYYCADLTRTYPVSGTFTERQRELYTIVLETQEFIAKQARPGMWLSNKDKPEESLHHLALKFLAEYGYDKYFVHGIGHFLGLDVHDVGDRSMPLAEGDVFTIEPGLYLPHEGIGIRIEDDYWVIKDGVICLSEDLPKSVEDIEKLVQQRLNVAQEESSGLQESYSDQPSYDDEEDDEYARG